MDKQTFEIVTKSDFVVASAKLESWQQAQRFYDEYLDEYIRPEYYENFILDIKKE